MRVTVSSISDIFQHIAELLEIKGENVFKIRAYQKAALILQQYPGDLAVLARKGELTTLEGIGKDLALKIQEILDTGTLAYYEELKASIPEGVVALMNISGIGPKKAKLFYEKSGIDSIEALEKAIAEKKLNALEGIKEKTIANIVKGIELYKQGNASFAYLKAFDQARRCHGLLKPFARRLEIAGSLRRKKPFVRDIDILASSGDSEKIMGVFTKADFVQEVLSHGPTKSSVRLRSAAGGIQVDLRVVEDDSFGAALLYFTGSKDFNIKIRGRALDQGYKVNEYGLFKKEKNLAGREEKDIFEKLGLSYIPPELRENTGEIEYAAEHKQFDLVDVSDLRGEFHVHSRYSDGSEDIETIVKYAGKKKYEYIGISDHSASLKVANGLSDERLKQKIEEIRELNKKYPKIKILCCQEVDILDDGSLDCPESLLKQLDVVIAAVHTGLKQPVEKITKRIVTACGNKYVSIIAHPTGILRGVREAYAVDLPAVYKAAARNTVALEINCFPDRLDLNEINARAARDAGVKLALGSDSHRLEHLIHMELGINVARRAWLKKKDLLNTLSLKELMPWIQKKRNL